MEDAISCPNRRAFRAAVTAGSVFAALFVWVVLDPGAPWSSAAIYGAAGAACAVGAFRACRDVDLRSDGTVELRYLRRCVLTSAREISEVRFTEGEFTGSFRVRYLGGKFTIKAGRQGRRLIEAVLRLNPEIALTGDTYTPLGGT